MKNFKATSAQQVIELAKKQCANGYFARTSVYSYEYFNRTYYTAIVEGANEICHFAISKKTAHDLADNYNFSHENLK